MLQNGLADMLMRNRHDCVWPYCVFLLLQRHYNRHYVTHTTVSRYHQRRDSETLYNDVPASDDVIFSNFPTFLQLLSNSGHSHALAHSGEGQPVQHLCLFLLLIRLVDCRNVIRMWDVLSLTFTRRLTRLIIRYYYLNWDCFLFQLLLLPSSQFINQITWDHENDQNQHWKRKKERKKTVQYPLVCTLQFWA